MKFLRLLLILKASRPLKKRVVAKLSLPAAIIAKIMPVHKKRSVIVNQSLLDPIILIFTINFIEIKIVHPAMLIINRDVRLLKIVTIIPLN